MAFHSRRHNAEDFQNEIDKETEKLEKKMLDIKPWYMNGEVYAKNRNENTVLEEHLDVQRHGLFKPEVKDLHTIEEFIIKSIKEQAFDSPVFKIKQDLQNTPKPLLLESSVQKSLVEDYQSVLSKTTLLDKNQGDPVKNAIQSEISELFEKLDSLSQLHFVPHKHSQEAKVIQNDLALMMEDAGPVVTSKSELLAPEEICAPRGELIKGKSELCKTDQRRHRRKLMRVRSKKNDIYKSSKSITDKQTAMARVIKMAHRPNSNIKIIN